MKNCKHTNTSYSQDYGYTGRFACDGAAQGGIEWKETCLDCGATRWHASNGRHSDRSQWESGINHRLADALAAAKKAAQEDYPDWKAIARALIVAAQREVDNARTA